MTGTKRKPATSAHVTGTRSKYEKIIRVPKVYHKAEDLSSMIDGAASLLYLIDVSGVAWATFAAAWDASPLPVWYGAACAIAATVPIGAVIAGVAWLVRRATSKKEERAGIIRGDVLCRILGGTR